MATTSVEQLIEKMVRRIVKKFNPERIILFGSHATGVAGSDSDIDLLIVMPVPGSKRKLQIEMRTALHDLPVSKDLIVTTPEEFAWRKDIVGTIEYPAAKEGKVLYARG